jgi:hypothetical protein
MTGGFHGEVRGAWSPPALGEVLMTTMDDATNWRSGGA